MGVTVLKLPINRENPIWVAGQIGSRIRRLRLQRGWTQEELARRAGIGLSSLQKLELSGKGTIDRLLQVAATLDVLQDCARLFEDQDELESLHALERRRRQRAPKQTRGGDR